MKNIRDNHGITLISLAVTIGIMLILTISLTASMTSTIELKKYNEVKEDIIALTEEVKVYYLKNESLPIYDSATIDIPNIVYEKDRNPNDSGNYYPINISQLSGDLSLNLGEGNKNQNFATDDLYVVNEKSLTVYYVQGAVLDGKRHYTIVDDFFGGSFAEEYYSKIDLPIISAVTMESNGKDKMHAGIGDTVTLKILSNYDFTTLPTVTINNENVDVTWNGKIGIATYTLQETYDVALYNAKIPFKISNYSADNRNGNDITDVTIGQPVYSYAKSIIELYNIGIAKIGDYVNYTYDTAGDYSLPSTFSGYSSNQTISQTTGLKWRLLNIDESTGKIDLVSETLTSTNVYFQGALGYNNGIYLLNDMCAQQYSNISLGVTARSINLEDTEKHLTEAGLVAKYGDTSSNGVKYGDTKTYTSSSYRIYPLLWAKQNGSGIDLDLTGLEPTATDYQDKVRAKLKKDGISESDTYYSTPTAETSTTAGTGITVQKTGYDNITFNSTNYGDVGVVLNSDNWYWIASHYTQCYDYAHFGLHVVANTFMGNNQLFYSNGTENSAGGRLRPVVSLESNLVDTSLGKDENGAWQIRAK